MSIAPATTGAAGWRRRNIMAVASADGMIQPGRAPRSGFGTRKPPARGSPSVVAATWLVAGTSRPDRATPPRRAPVIVRAIGMMNRAS